MGSSKSKHNASSESSSSRVRNVPPQNNIYPNLDITSNRSPIEALYEYTNRARNSQSTYRTTAQPEPHSVSRNRNSSQQISNSQRDLISPPFVNVSRDINVANSNPFLSKQNNLNNVTTLNSGPVNDSTRNSEKPSGFDIKHEIFLKKLVSNFHYNSTKRNRGHFCSACKFYELSTNKKKKEPKVYHDNVEAHKKNISDKENIKRRYCKSCRAHFFMDANFWAHHLGHEIHLLFYGLNRRKRNVNDGNNKRNSVNIPIGNDHSGSIFRPMSSFSIDELLPTNHSRCLLKKEMILKFLHKLSIIGSDKVKYDFYCHMCEFWTDDGTVWKVHTADTIHSDVMYGTVGSNVNCTVCHFVILGSKVLSEFHRYDGGHDKFEEFLLSEWNKVNEEETKLKLNIPATGSDYDLLVNISDDDDDDEDDDGVGNNEENDKTSVTGTINNRKNCALLLTDLPDKMNRQILFQYFKDFGRIDVINFLGKEATIIFAMGFLAFNIVENEMPIVINDKKITVTLIEQ